MSGAILWLLPVLTNGMATFGWCSTEKPALFTWPSHVLDRGLEFWFCSLLLLGGHNVGYSKCKSAFSISSATISLSPLLPTCVQLPQEQVAHTVLCFMFRLGRFLMLCNKQQIGRAHV